MSQGIHTTPSRRLSVIWAGLALAAASLLAVAAPAAAHDELIGSDPATGATLEALPPQLTLTFSAAIAPDSGASEVQVTDASGATLADGAPVVQDNVLTQALSGEASGAVTILWKVVSSDGHPISGELSFTVTPAATPDATASTEPSQPAEPSDETEPTDEVSAVPVDGEDAGATSGDVWPWVIGGIVVAGVGGAVVYLLASRARRQRDLEAARDGAADAARRATPPPADQ